ncbi:MAG: purine-binding chemotaxis protein CheW [Bryobacterales bacterium]|nr:purine-binding chemotaxis protein CheW [Bryobacterales bacterium]
MVTLTERSGPASASSGATAPGKFLTFCLGGEDFAVPVSKIKEIIGLQEVTPVPQTPDFVRGVINLRGKVVPVIDLRRKLSIPGAADNERTCVVVMQPEGRQGTYSIGVVVDAVSEVLQIQGSEMEDTNSFSHGLIRATYIHGVAKIRGKVKILLDIDSVLSDSDQANVGELMA